MSSQPNHSVHEGLACLQALALAGEPVGCRELARRMGLHPVRVNRLLMTLAAGQFARQDARRRYLPGPAFQVLAAAAVGRSSLLRQALPHLTALARDTGAVVALGVLWRDQVCYLWYGDAQVGAEALGAANVHDAHTSSIGQILLACAGQQDLAHIAAQGYACLRHGSEDRPHLSVAVAVGELPHAGLACTHLPLTTDLVSLVKRLRLAAASIATAFDREHT